MRYHAPLPQKAKKTKSITSRQMQDIAAKEVIHFRSGEVVIQWKKHAGP